MALFLRSHSGVTLRITTSEDDAGAVMSIDGRLDAEGVLELEQVVARLSGPLRLDLFNLRSVDEAGRQALQALRARGVTLTRVSPFHRLLLQQTAPRNRRRPSAEPGGSGADPRPPPEGG